MSPTPKLVAIIGASGKVGLTTSRALRQSGVPVRAILRDASKAAQLTDIGCEIAMADVQNTDEVAKAIGDADAVQVIVPPAPQAPDTALQMRQAIESLAWALEKTKPKRVLAISDYGAHVDQDIGMPTLCQEIEERLGRLDCHKIFLRSAEHMEGWGRAIPAAVASGVLPSFHDPLDQQFPTVSAPDVGLISAELLMRGSITGDNSTELFHVEGPQRYSAHDVASAVSQLLGRAVQAEAVPRSSWTAAFEKVMSGTLAELLVKANDAQNEGGLVDVEPNGQVLHGKTELIDALKVIMLDKGQH